MEVDNPIIDFPLRGPWKAIRSPGHHRFAYDFAAVGGPSKRTLPFSTWHLLTTRLPAETFYSWSQPVYAPQDGMVVEASDGWLDRMNLSLLRDLIRILASRPRSRATDIRPFAGNYVVLQLPGAFAFLAHFRRGTVAVKDGQAVQAGELLAEVGNSGFSLTPHLHFQLMDGPNPSVARVIPFRFSSYECWNGKTWQPRINAVPAKGEIIRSPLNI